MFICRLCAKDTAKNDRLLDRPFREKIVDVLCLWLDVEDEIFPTNVCNDCQACVEQFHTFKRLCRTTQDDFKSGAISIPMVPVSPGLEDASPSESTGSEEASPASDCADIVRKTLAIITSLSPPKKRGRPRKPKDPNQAPKPKKERPRGYKMKPRLDANGERLVVPRPWRRKLKEAIDLSVEEYREFSRKKANTRKKASSVCEVCGKEVATTRMDGHRNRHAGLEPYTCEVCGDKFSCRLNMKTHWRRNHAQEDHRVECETCGKEMVTVRALKQHIKNVHSERRFQCTMCPLKWHTRASLNTHLKIHNQTRDYKCPICEKAFYAKSVWNIHMRTHSGETPYKCSVVACARAFVHRNMYVAHMTKNHPGEPLMQLIAKHKLKETLKEKYETQ